MRGSWLRAAVLGVVIGAPMAPLEPGAAEPPEAERLTPHRTSGHAARGPGYYVWDEDAREVADWAFDLARSAGETVESARWRAIAVRAAAGPSLRMADEEVELAARIESFARESDISPLGMLLCLLPSVDRTCLISSCATSPDAQIRLALVRALTAPFEAVGVRGALDHLQNDASAEVREQARSAAAARGLPLG